MLGYMTKDQAIKHGFTHEGSYYGIPIWITDEETPMVATKWAPMEFVVTIFHIFEGLGNLILNRENMFMFKILRPIEGV